MVPVGKSGSLKRSRSLEDDGGYDGDTENTGPSIFFPRSKKSKRKHDDVHFKAPRCVLQTVKDIVGARAKHPLPSTWRYTQSPLLSKLSSPSTPTRATSARIPAYRCCKGQKGNRRKAIHITRPHFSSFQGALPPASPSLAPFNTFPAPDPCTRVSNVNNPTQARWRNIHQDTEEEELENFFIHATCTLDITDYQGMKYRRGKENILPAHHPSAVVPQNNTLRPDHMPRIPLGDLDYAELFYEGLP